MRSPQLVQSFRKTSLIKKVGQHLVTWVAVMELKTVDNSRVILLTQLHRPAGQLFLPMALEAIVNRYHFQKFPSPESCSFVSLSFQQGVFDGVAIDEFAIYPDGVVVSSRSNTDDLDAFVDDLLAWARSDLGLIETGVGPRERHYESALVVILRINAGDVSLDGEA